VTHGSLFSGIGGFDLAAHWAGITNVFAVEKEPFPQAVLRKRFPDTKIYGDIFDFDATEYRGRVDIISGGFPCQPFSLAGKRRGHEDDRYLWPQMLRVVQQVEPTWVIAENVRGLTTITNGETLERVISDLEDAGYEVQPFIIPAVGVGAPHKRERIWIIAHSNGTRESQPKRTNEDKWRRTFNESKKYITPNTTNPDGVRSRGGRDRNNSNDRERFICENEQNDRNEIRGETTSCNEFDTANTDNGCGNQNEIQARGKVNDVRHTREWDELWIEAITRIYGMDDGLPGGMDRLDERYRDRSRKDRIKACGNAIVPQIAYILFKTIIETEAA